MRQTGGRGRLTARLVAVVALLGLGACAGRGRAELAAPQRFSNEVRAILAMSGPSQQYFVARSRLERMGPEVDAVLVSLARDPGTKLVARVNALILLADRRSPAALPVLGRVLLTEGEEELRAAAVLALARLSSTDEAAVRLIRGAVGDPSRIVRLNALQALDIREVEAIRSVAERDPDAEVREVATQLVALAEARGAPLAPDRRGALRTAGTERDPQIVFRPVRTDTLSRTAYGDLRVELPNAQDIPLSARAEVVQNVLPAFFAPDRSRVVYEADREVRVVDLGKRQVRAYGPGIAPRPIPFTNQFIFLREVPHTRVEERDGTELTYEVYRAGFAGRGGAERIGVVRAVARMDRHANYSPVRWMVVMDSPEGFVLRAVGLEDFLIPSAAWRPGQQDPSHDRNGW